MKKFKFNIRGNNYDVEVKSLDDGIAKIEVNGTSYRVELEKEERTSKTPVLRRAPVATPKDAHKIKKTEGSIHKVKAPLPGNILKLKVNVGDTVTTGDLLMIYEAMKMENKLTADKSGTITSIQVKEGDSVLENDVLLEMELS